jgi:hypothetical protein
MNAPVQVWTRTLTFGYEPTYDDGAANTGELKRAATLIRSEYPEQEFTDKLTDSLASAPPGSRMFFEGGRERFEEHQELALLEAATAAKRARDIALANESDYDREQREAHERHKAKLDAIGYRPSPGFEVPA